jgi:hypothetical protein
VAKSRAPLEEFFTAVIGHKHIEVYLKGDGQAVLWAELTNSIIPESSVWSYKMSRRHEIPKDAEIERPAYYNMILTIIISKANPSFWGEICTEMQTPDFAMPKEPANLDSTKFAQMVLSPSSTSPLVMAERAQKLVTAIETSEDVILNKVYFTFHIWEHLYGYLARFRVDASTFFAVEVKEQLLTVLAIAGAPYPMCELKLFGTCDPTRTTWELGAGKLEGQESEHMVIKVTMTKSASSRGTKWGVDAYEKLEPYQVSQELIEGPKDPDYAAIAAQRSEMNESGGLLEANDDAE